MSCDWLLCLIASVLLPGGATFFNQTKGYADAGRYIYDIARRMNDNDQHMPLFGTCLGFELLLYLSAGSLEYRETCLSQRRSLALNFTEGKTARRSRSYQKLTALIYLFPFRCRQKPIVWHRTRNDYRHFGQRKRHTKLSQFLSDQRGERPMSFVCKMRFSPILPNFFRN